MAAPGGMAVFLCCLAICFSTLMVDARRLDGGNHGGMSQADLNAIEILERVRRLTLFAFAVLGLQ